MKGQAILVQMVEGQLISTVISYGADLVAAMGVRGYEENGVNTSTRLRAELQGAPKFKGVHGPSWGGEDHPLRYESVDAYQLLSR